LNWQNFVCFLGLCKKIYEMSIGFKTERRGIKRTNLCYYLIISDRIICWKIKKNFVDYTSTQRFVRVGPAKIGVTVNDVTPMTVVAPPKSDTGTARIFALVPLIFQL